MPGCSSTFAESCTIALGCLRIGRWIQSGSVAPVLTSYSRRDRYYEPGGGPHWDSNPGWIVLSQCESEIEFKAQVESLN